MSVFIVLDKTINKIASALNHDSHFKIRLEGLLKREDLTAQDIVDFLVDMNYRAVNQRYGENKSNKVVFVPMNTPLPALYKHLSCYLYQCSEGDVYDSKAFKLVEEFQAHLAGDIIEKMPEYHQAEWD